jgi:uroporphyrin-III C-methyltransferase / precorrin-2 dehydrogenase / sirohydrochlorin ferrochelatase
MSNLLPLFVNLAGRRVLLVGGGPVAASKLSQLLAAGADVRVVAPQVHADIQRQVGQVGRVELVGQAGTVTIERREFVPADVNDAWLVVAAATLEVNRAVAEAAEARRVLVNAVDDPRNASAFLGGVVRRGGVTLAISTSGDAPGLTALLRQALDALMPREVGDWVREARHQRKVWRQNRVPMEKRRPLLLEALNKLYDGVSGFSRTRSADDIGKPDDAPVRVSLVGAGPGDPGLLTRTGVARLRAADLVLFDALVDERVVRLARHAQRFFVGKRAGRHALTQNEIHAVMIRAARRGRRVVRLKGGDPFVFGRGGEEAMALASAGVSFEVVPGVTSAIAAPGLAGIPVTHRGLASAFLVTSGHDEEAFAELAGRLSPNGVTIVVLMGLATRAALASQLLARGWECRTPAALVVDASLPGQQAWRGTLDELAAGQPAVETGGISGAATLVVGEVAALQLRSATVVESPEMRGIALRRGNA